MPPRARRLRETLRTFTPERVLAALTTGSMKEQGSALSDEQKRAISELVTGKGFGGGADRTAAGMSNRCAAPLKMDNALSRPRWNGWNPDGTTSHRFMPAETGKLTAEQVPRLKLKWAVAFADAASVAQSQPVVVGGAVFIGTDNNFVYALDAKTGCVHWSYDAKSQVRGAVNIGEPKTTPGVRYAAYFGDMFGIVHAVNAETGAGLWTLKSDPHPGAKITGAPTMDPDRHSPLRARRLLGGADRLHRQLRVLQVPGQRRGGRRENRKAGLEDVHDARTACGAEQEELGRQAAVRARGRLGLERADARHEAAGRLCRHRQLLHHRALRQQSRVRRACLRCGRRLRHEHGQADVDHSVDSPHDADEGGCGRGPERRINCPGYVQGPGDDVNATLLATLPNGKRALLASQESGRITALRSRQRRRHPVDLSSRRHAVAQRRQPLGRRVRRGVLLPAAVVCAIRPARWRRSA